MSSVLAQRHSEGGGRKGVGRGGRSLAGVGRAGRHAGPVKGGLGIRP